MKTLLKISLLILFLIYDLIPSGQISQDTTLNSSVTEGNFQFQDSEVIEIDTLIINGLEYIQTFKSSRFTSLLTIKGDTIINAKDYYFKIDTIDINEDSYKDIRVYFMSNNPYECDNYLFNEKLKTFKYIENATLGIQHIKGTKNYYSYNSCGCADMNWESYLSKIENYKLINYGYINGKGCEGEQKVIEIYRIYNSNSEEKILVKKLPYRKYINKFRNKWTFLDNYWKQNFKNFKR
jgi:hypothetical protein